MLGRSRLLANITGDPQYHRLLRKMKLQEYRSGCGGAPPGPRTR